MGEVKDIHDAIIEALNYDVDTEEIEKAEAAIQNIKIEFTKKAAQKEEEKFKREFAIHDPEGKGHIALDKFRELLKEFMKDTEAIDNLIRKYNKHADGVIHYKEFVEMSKEQELNIRE